jgi:hypothetical protein
MGSHSGCRYGENIAPDSGKWKLLQRRRRERSEAGRNKNKMIPPAANKKEGKSFLCHRVGAVGGDFVLYF